MPTACELLIAKVKTWATKQNEITGILLVGSQARGEARQDSDVDLVIICREPEQYLNDTEWIHLFGVPARKDFEDWGKMTSLRVWFEAGLEVEFGITDEDWVKEPLDAGTKAVTKDGYRILFDRSKKISGILEMGART